MLGKVAWEGLSHGSGVGLDDVFEGEEGGE